jgi:hypothetical protein
MRYIHKSIVLAFSLLFSVSVVVAAAQAECPAIVQQALAATDTACADTGRNQACYGNIDLSAVPQEGVTDFVFSQPGDLVDVTGVQTLTLAPLDEQGDTWGVALMRIQANLPDTLPGQNVTFLLFGDVEIQNAVDPNQSVQTTAPLGVTLDVTISSPTPLLESITGDTGLPELLDAGTQVVADGQAAFGQMLHVTLADGRAGWIPAAMVQVDGDVTTLPEFSLDGEPPAANADAPVALTPMQAFYFKTGLNDSPCTEAPDSGILIQTPEGAGKIDLVVNDVKVSLGSTGYFQAQPGAEMTISVVEGEAEVESDGVTVTVPAGMQTGIPVDDELHASGAPEEPQPYDELGALPISVLPREITIAEPLAEATVSAASDAVPVPGQWTSTGGDAELGGSCDPMFAEIFSGQGVFGESTTFTMPEGAFSLEAVYRVNSAEMPGGMIFANPAPGVHTMDLNQEGVNLHYEFRIISSTRIEATMTMNFDSCIMTVLFVMEPVGG